MSDRLSILRINAIDSEACTPLGKAGYLEWSCGVIFNSSVHCKSINLW